MDKIQLHAGGSTNHLKALKEKYNLLQAKVQSKNELTVTQKKMELKKLSQSFKLEKRKARWNLF
jgi:hypothetical protein